MTRHLRLHGGFSNHTLTWLTPRFPFAVVPYACVPTFLSYCGTGISTRCPSDTHFGLSLGPDLPGADQLYPGNLGYSAARILTLLSLLIPAFSLPINPLLLSVQLRLYGNAPLPTHHYDEFLSFGGAFEPRTFSAQELSTSELLRTL